MENDKYINLSNGKSDGFVLFYVKDGIIYPVLLREQQAQAVDMMLGIAIEGKVALALNKPQGTLKELTKEDIKKSGNKK